MLTFKEYILAKIFNNPLGREYFNVPKGKKIYKITRSSAHYFTGDIAENGLPIICTGAVSPNERNPFIYWLETWKPIHLCWFFIKMGWKIPKYFIGVDTGAISPATMASSNSPAIGATPWQNPDNAKTENTVYSQCDAGGSVPIISYYLKATNFGFAISGTINGIKVEIKRRAQDFDDTMKDYEVKLIKADASLGSTNKALTSFWTTTNHYETYGGAADLWGETPTAANVNDVDWGVALAVRFTASSENALVDHIRMTIYYTATTNYTSTLSDTVNLTASLLKAPSRILSQTITLTATLLKTPNKILSEVLTITANMLRVMTRTFSETLALVATSLQQATRIFTETVVLTDTIAALKVIYEEFTETLTIADQALGRIIQHVITETLTLTATVSRISTRVFNEVVSLTDTFERALTSIRVFTETVSLTDVIARVEQRLLEEVVTLTDTFAHIRYQARIFTETITHTDTFAYLRTQFKTLSEVVSLLDQLIVQLNGIVTNGWAKVARTLDEWTKTPRN